MTEQANNSSITVTVGDELEHPGGNGRRLFVVNVRNGKPLGERLLMLEPGVVIVTGANPNRAILDGVVQPPKKVTWEDVLNNRYSRHVRNVDALQT